MRFYYNKIALLAQPFYLVIEGYRMTFRQPASLATILFLFTTSTVIANAADWPTYQHDNHRSGATDATLKPASFGPLWTWQSPHPPQPAWAGPAKWDAYAGLRNLKSMRNYDPVFHVVAVGDRVLWGSTVDDSVHCVEAATGKTSWKFTTDGPIRVAPACHDGRVYFGSDDGYAYCVALADGKLVWKHRPIDPEQKIINNGRFISRWPVRTGVVVDGKTAYFAASLLPWKSSYLCAVDAATGQPKGDGRYTQKIEALTFEGPLVASPQMLIAPQGRVAPQLFRRADGKRLGGLRGGGGSFVVLTDKKHILHGPGNKTGWITSSNPANRAQIASYKNANAMVVRGDRSYVLTDTQIRASDWVKRKHLWTASGAYPFSLILTHDHLIAGGRDEVAIFDAKAGRLVWKHSISGRAYGLAVAGGRLLVSTDTGAIYAFAPGATTKDPIVRTEPKKKATSPVTPKPSPLQPITKIADADLLGRWVFQGPHAAAGKAKDLAGKTDAKLLGKAKLVRQGKYAALRLDGKTVSARIADDHNQATLPTKQFTAEAWVQIDKPQQWGGLIGAFQDNGNYERGWILGYTGSKFCIGVSAKRGAPTMTYLAANTPFRTKTWYHVAGTYDGTTMKLLVNGRLAAVSKTQQGDINYPPRTFYEIGAYHDKDENYRAKGLIHEVRVYRRVLSEAELKKSFESKPFDQVMPLTLPIGPWVQFTKPGEAVIRWHTDKPSPSILEVDFSGNKKNFTTPALTTEHAVTVTGLVHNRAGTYVVKALVDGKNQAADPQPIDTFYNYSLLDAGAEKSPYADSKLAAQAAAEILRQTTARRGLCLDYGCGDGQLAYELARSSNLRIICVDQDPTAVKTAREKLQQTGLYGSRITVHHVDDLAKLPLVGHGMNLIVSGRAVLGQLPAGGGAEVKRLLRPDGGQAIIGQPSGAVKTKLNKPALAKWLAKPTVTESKHGLWAVVTRAALGGAGEWTHLYGRSDNSAFGGESLAGASSTEDLQIQWLGRPGPRFQVDRNGRKPSPLSTAGRLFVQGHDRIAALDSYNGTILWSLEIPSIGRFNMPRDSGNWCVDREHIYLAVRDKLWQISAASGQLVKQHDVVAPNGDPQPLDWSYLASGKGQLIGSATRRNSAWRNFWGKGGQGWYDAAGGPVTHKICSDNLFSLDKKTGKTRWTYQDGVVINSTITLAAKRVFFVESRSAEVRKLPTRRIGNPALWNEQFLVALDAETGKKVWERSIDTANGDVGFHLAHAQDTLTLVASTGGRYHVHTYEAGDGEPRWNTQFAWGKRKADHGSHLSRPVIVGKRLYVRPAVLNLADGKILPIKIPVGGCGTYVATTGALFFRAGSGKNASVWDVATGRYTMWNRLRPDCWLSTIPAGGMLLAPEGGGGCSCGKWLETSVGMIPRAARRGKPAP